MVDTSITALYNVFTSSVDPSLPVRNQAEEHLKQLSQVPGFSAHILTLITSPDGEVHIKQAAAVFFKNWIEKGWYLVDQSEAKEKFVISNQDKTFVKENICKVISSVADKKSIRAQLLTAFNRIIRTEYPQSYDQLPSLLKTMVEESTSMVLMEASLLAFYELVNWKGHGPESSKLSTIYEIFFPKIILGVAQQALQYAKQNFTNPEQRDQALWVVKAAIKCFFAAIRYKWCSSLLAGNSFEPWSLVLNDLLSMPIPDDVIKVMLTNTNGQLREADMDTIVECERSAFWKARKWAMHVHNRVLQLYVVDADKNDNPEIMTFAKLYTFKLSSSIVGTILGIIENVVKGSMILGPKAFSLICDFISIAIRSKPIWKALGEKHLITIMKSFVFPRACWTHNDDLLWETDPAECIKSRFVDCLMLDSDSNGLFASTAINLIVDVIKCRKKHLLVPFLSFLTEKLSVPISDWKSACEIEGVFYVLGSLSTIMASNPQLAPQLEAFMINHVVLTLNSQNKYQFLRARSAWVLEQFVGDDKSGGMFEKSALTFLDAIVKGLLDVNSPLPVRTQTALALGPLIDYTLVQEAIPPVLPKVVESILQVSELIELDALSFVLERLVNSFPDELAPYAEQLASQLVHSFVRILAANQEGQQQQPSENQGMYFEDTDRMMAAVGLLSAINALVEAMSSSLDIIARLEPICQPLILAVLQGEVVDVYEEAFELLDTITFARKCVTPSMWAIFEAMYCCFRKTVTGRDYLADMQTSFDNFISYGGDGMSQAHINAVIDVVDIVMRPSATSKSDATFSEADLISACKLIESLLLNQKARIGTEEFKHMIGLAIASMLSHSLTTTPFSETQEKHSEEVEYRGGFHTLLCFVGHLQVILNGLYCEPLVTVTLLEAVNYSETFFTVWFCLASRLLSRVHDRRLTILAIGSVLRANCVPSKSLDIWTRRALPLLLESVLELPKALANRAKLIKEFEEEEEDEDDDSSYQSSTYEELEDEDDDDDAREQERRFINTAISKSSSLINDNGYDDVNEEEYEDADSYEDAADELEEELYFETPFDIFDFASIAKETVSIFANQPTVNQVLSALTTEERNFMQSIIH